jgi:hypothetical protein
MSLDPTDPNYTPPAPSAEELAAKDAEIEQLKEQLAAAQTVSAAAAPTTSSTATIGVAPATVTSDEPVDPNAQQVTVHAIAPGSAGVPVAELAELVEKAGEKTYLSDGTHNVAHVFTDDLLAAVRRILHTHPDIAAVTDEGERQRLNRWIGNLHVVTGDVWALIQDVADSKAAAAA